MAILDGEPWVLAASEIIDAEPGIGYRKLHERLKAKEFTVARQKVQQHLASHRAAAKSTPLVGGYGVESAPIDDQPGYQCQQEEPKAPKTLRERSVIVSGPTAKMIRENGLGSVGLCVPCPCPDPTPLESHSTDLSSEQVPFSLNMPVPFFTHQQCAPFLVNSVPFDLPITLMTAKMIGSRHGEEVSDAICYALEKFKSDPFPDAEGPTQVWRHILAVYLVQQPGEELPVELGDFIAGFFNKGTSLFADNILRELLGDNAQRKRHEIRLAIHSALNCGQVDTVVVMVLSNTMDIWNPLNKSSPARRAMLNRVQNRCRHTKSPLLFENCGGPSKADPGTKRKEEKADRAFAALSFEEVLAEEKVRMDRCRAGSVRMP